jgi:HK97 family phage prohead protease
VKQLNTESVVIFEEREDKNGDIVGSGHGMAVPYGSETMIGGVRESFAPNSFDLANVIGKPLAYRHGEPVGKITGAENREDGLYIDFEIVDTALGRDAAVLARTSTIKGLSVGFNPVKSIMSKARDAIQHTAANLLEVSLTPYPAYSTAGVSAIRETEGATMLETTESTEVNSVDIEAREAVKKLRDEFVSQTTVNEPEPHPLAQYRTFGDYSKAVIMGEETRALFDQVTTNNPGVMPPTFLNEVKGIIDLGRRVITATGGPESAGTSGLDISWPYFAGDLSAIVAAQSAEKGEVNSVAVNILKNTATLLTYAAGSDISFQLLQRSLPSYLDSHNRIMLASYATVTDRKFTADLWALGTGSETYVLGSDTTGSVFRSTVFNASVKVEDATGAPATAVFVSTAVFKAIGGWSTFMPESTPVTNVSGLATASTLRVTVSGLPVVRAKWLDTNVAYDAIVTNGTAARWLEDGPNLITADNVAKLGQDVAVYGYGVTAGYLPAGIVKIS